MFPFLFFVACLACDNNPPGYVSRAEFGEKWPLTVDEGELHCSRSKVTFTTTDGKVYAVNGTAKAEFPPIDPIWKTASLPLDYKPLERLPEQARRAIFAGLVNCEDEADRKGEQKYPTDVRKQVEEQNKLTEDCRIMIRKRLKLTPEELGQISAEGVAVPWPPLTPTRMSIGPLIDRGLKLCQ